jgi:hypothetical protein
VVLVPNFVELAATRIVELIAANPNFLEYLPDLRRTKKPLNRQYVYNVRAPQPLTS